MVVNLKGLTYSNLPERLERQASGLELEGWLTAARLIRNAADTLNYLQEQGVIELDNA